MLGLELFATYGFLVQSAARTARTTIIDAALGSIRLLDLKSRPAAILSIINHGTFQIAQGSVIHDDLDAMVFEDLIIVPNVVIDRHAVLGPASTCACNVNAQAVVDQFALLEKILHSFSSRGCHGNCFGRYL